jgi:hypothetical protein
MGYAAMGISIQPFNFLFMPKKSGLANQLNKTIQQSIQSIFGEHKIDEDSVKYYASWDFYLPDILENLKVQNEMCVKFLDQMTIANQVWPWDQRDCSVHQSDSFWSLCWRIRASKERSDKLVWHCSKSLTVVWQILFSFKDRS